MARNQGRNASIVYGICTNTSGKEDGTPCSKCQSKEKQAIRASKDFVCEECGEPLKKIEVKEGNKKLPIIIAAAVVVIGGAVGAILGLGGGNKPSDEEQAQHYIDSMRQVREADSLAQLAAAADAERQQQMADSLEQARIADSIAKAEAEQAAKKQEPKPANNNGANLGWGSYSGPMQGGKPHGVGGTIKVKQNYSIDLKDGRGSMLDVRPGETIENTKFENGRLRAGELHRANGERKWFNC